MTRDEILTELMLQSIHMRTSFPFFFEGNISRKQLNNAKARFAYDAEESSVLGLYDTTVFTSGKEGFLFTDTAVYIKQMSQDPIKLFYSQIVSMEITGNASAKDSDKKLIVYLRSGAVQHITTTLIHKTPLQAFLAKVSGAAVSIPHAQEKPPAAKPPVQDCAAPPRVIVTPVRTAEAPSEPAAQTAPAQPAETAEEKDKLQPYAELLNRCGKEMFTTSGVFHKRSAVPAQIIKNAKAVFARDLVPERVIGFYDTTLFKSGKEGFVFTPDALYLKEVLSTPVKIVYRDITDVSLTDEPEDSKRTINVTVHNDFCYKITSAYIRKTAFAAFLKEAAAMAKQNGEGDAVDSGYPANSFMDHIYRLVYRYADWICPSGRKYVCRQIPENIFHGAKDKYAGNAQRELCFFLTDTSLLRTGATGIMVTLWGVYSYATLESKIAVYYGDILTFEAEGKALKIVLKNGTRLTLDNTNISAGALSKMLNEIMAFYYSYLYNPSQYAPEQDMPYRQLVQNALTDESSKQNNAWLEKQSAYGNPYAVIERANRFRSGVGQEKDAAQAVSLYLSVHHPAAYRKAAQMYFNGEATLQDASEGKKLAEKYFAKARELGDLESSIGIANMYFLGINHKVDYQKAFDMYKELADTVEHSKLPMDLYANLGMCYYFGYGCEQDSKQAEYWLQTAKDDNAYSEFLYGSLLVDTKTDDAERRRGYGFIRESADAECVDAMVRLALLTAEGELCEKDMAAARGLLQKAAETGNAVAQYQYGVFLISPENDQPEPAHGFEEIKKAADQGYVDAVRDLAVCYQYAIGVKRDIAQACRLYEEAAAAGDAFSKEWKEQTKLFLNRIKMINTSCVVNETGDESEWEDLYVSDVDENLTYQPQDRHTVAAMVTSYPLVTAYQNRDIIQLEKHTMTRVKWAKAARAMSLSVSQIETALNTAGFRNFLQMHGKGPAMEYAAHINDRLHFKNARWIGIENAPNGADRIVNGRGIQSKCYDPHTKGDPVNRLLNALTPKNDSGVRQARYPGQQIELNSDMYNTLTDGDHNEQWNQLKELYGEENIKSSGLTSKQCENIAKFGTVDSLRVDLKAGTVAGTQAFAMSMVITFAVSRFSGMERKEALRQSLLQAAKAFGQAAAVTVVTAQVMRLSAVNHLAISPKLAGKGMQKMLSRATGQNIHTVTAAQNVLRSGIVTAAVTTVVLSAADVARLISGRISKEQLLKNVTVTASSVVAGSVGGLIGGAICGAISPKFSTVGMIAGAAIASGVVGKAVQNTLDGYIENDGDKMLAIFNAVLGEIATEYLLAEDELNYVIDRVMETKLLSDSGLRDIYASDDRNSFCRTVLTPLADEVCELRGFVVLPTAEDFAEVLRDELDEEDL